MSHDVLKDLPETERYVLVCDDEPHIREPVAIFLRQNGFEVDTAVDGADGFDKFQKKDYFLVVTDINMPGLTGIELLAKVKETKPQTDVVMITGNVDLDFAINAIKQGAYDYFRKPFDFEDVLLTVSRVVEKRRLTRQAAEATRLRGERDASERNAIEAVMALVQAVYSKDQYTRGHMERVGLYANIVAETMGIDATARKMIERAGILHDIGKIGTPDVILNKTGKLTNEEFMVIQLHPNVGAQIVRPITVLSEVAPLVRQHHEKWNGSGYPDKIAGEEISIEARVLAIADVFDALHSERAYRPGLPLHKSRQIIEDGSGSHFDPDVVNALISCLNDGSLLASVENARGSGQVSAAEKVAAMAAQAQEIIKPVEGGAPGAGAEKKEEEPLPAAPVAPAAAPAGGTMQEASPPDDDDEMPMDVTIDLSPPG
ncbi:MAG: HD domain-containing phosphohydrolase [Planctomycetota bacterium]|jgi:putative nucleotidyltransferase with HDIG domain